MTGPEFVVVLGWVLLPPLALAVALLAVLHRRNPGGAVSRTAGAVLLLVVASIGIAMGIVVAGPPGLGSYIGIRDAPVMWAPFAFIAVAVALPFAIWWASRSPRP